MQSGSKVVVRVSDASWVPVMSSWSRVGYILYILSTEYYTYYYYVCTYYSV